MFTARHVTSGAPAVSVMFAEDFGAFEGITIVEAADDEHDGSPVAALAPASHPDEIRKTEAAAIEMEAAKAAAFAAGFEAARADFRGAADLEAAITLAKLSDALADASQAARHVVESAAQSVAKIVLASLAAILPDVSSAFGDREAAALAAIVLHELADAPRVVIRVAPASVSAIEPVVANVDPERRGRIEIASADELERGDLRVSWQDGGVVRNSKALHSAVVKALASFGLFATVQSPAPSDVS